MTPLVIAHRTTMGHAPENTLAGVRAGLALGVDAIEFDVQASADGMPVLMHDTTVDRTTNGHGAVGALPFAALRALDAGGGERIPTLAETLDAMGRGAAPVIEIKAGMEAVGVDVVALVVAEVRRRGLAEAAWLWSFDAALIERLRARGAGLRIAHLCTEPTAEVVERTRRLALAGVSMQASQANAAVVERLRSEGFATFVWTANESEELARLARLPLTGIVTDYPERLRAVLPSGRKDAGAARLI